MNKRLVSTGHWRYVSQFNTYTICKLLRINNHKFLNKQSSVLPLIGVRQSGDLTSYVCTVSCVWVNYFTDPLFCPKILITKTKTADRPTKNFFYVKVAINMVFGALLLFIFACLIADTARQYDDLKQKHGSFCDSLRYNMSDARCGHLIASSVCCIFFTPYKHWVYNILNKMYC